MGIRADKAAATLLVYTRRLLFLSCLAAIGLSPARGQLSVPPLPALPVTFVFSNCQAGQTRTWAYTWSNFLRASVQTPRGPSSEFSSRFAVFLRHRTGVH